MPREMLQYKSEDDKSPDHPERKPMQKFKSLVRFMAPSSLVREYSGLLDDLDSDASNGSSEETEQTPPKTPPEEPEPSPPPPAKEQPPPAEEKPPSTEQNPQPTEEEVSPGASAGGGKAGGGKGLKLTLELEVDAASLSGDLGKYAGTSWRLTSPRVEGGGVPIQTPGPTEATPPRDPAGPSHGVPATKDPYNDNRALQKSPQSTQQSTPTKPRPADRTDKQLVSSNVRETTTTTGTTATTTTTPGVASPTDEQAKKLLRWFRSHFDRREIDCDFKLRHKIANGYLVGACLAHYHPRKIDSVDFNRGNSPANKAANWEFVQKFLGRRSYSLPHEDVRCLCTVPMPAEEGVEAASRVLAGLYAFLLADGLVPPLAGIAPAHLRAPPARRKVQIYKRFTDRRRSDMEEEEMMRMLAATGANVPENSGRRASGVGGGWKRSSSLPAASIRNAEEFHESRRTGGEGRGKAAAKDARGKEEPGKRSRSYAPGEAFSNADPAKREGRALGNVEGGRRRASPDSDLVDRGGGVEGAGGRGGGGRRAMPRDTRGFGNVRDGGEGLVRRAVKVGPRRLGRAPGYQESDGSSSYEGRHRPARSRRRGFGFASDDDDDRGNRRRHRVVRGVNFETTAPGGQSDPSVGGEEREYHRRRRRRRRRPRQQRRDGRLDDEHFRHHRAERFGDGQVFDGDARGARHQAMALRDVSDQGSSFEEGDTSPRRRQPRRAAAESNRSRTSPLWRERSTEIDEKGGVARHRARSGGNSNDRRDNNNGEGADAYFGRAAYATAASAAAPVGAASRSRHGQARDFGYREDGHDDRRRGGGRDRQGNNNDYDYNEEGAAFSTPFATPRRRAPQPAAATTAQPPKQSFGTWPGGRRGGGGGGGGGGGHAEGHGGGGYDYPSFPPSALPEGRRRRPRDGPAAAPAPATPRNDKPRSYGGGQRAIGGLAREEEAGVVRMSRRRDNADIEGEGRQRHPGGAGGVGAGGGGGTSGGRDRSRSWAREGTQRGKDWPAAEATGGRRGNGRGGGDGDGGGGGGAHTRPPDQHRSLSTNTGPGGADGLVPSHPRRRRERADGDGYGLKSSSGAGAVAGRVAPLPTKSTRAARNRSPVNSSAPLGKMSGFGQGDGGWSERVEGRRQRQLEQRGRLARSMVAEVNGDSGRIEPLSAAPPAAGHHHHQAVSPPRLRRLVQSEVPCTLQPPARSPLRGSSPEPQPAAPKAIARNKAESRSPVYQAMNQAQRQHQRPSLLPANGTTNRAGFNSYADDGATGVAVGVNWG
ncbi:hypothetical protein Esi_0238_0002 [Ectocarpus siliculosus]|uniref:Calponin-homology (CH) domain-containing protein n=1 Tax=Ectocarpus siliculosus TaxID=2880 RepID=D7FSP5_ECTSI|nr:hypothetical protein Esi_0238_0002 [Ectocarpus siliculosus]|eukprot:CBJ31186.1 hypothetical protein Esi_0238_0002 [Ectocarpus siliculosus]